MAIDADTEAVNIQVQSPIKLFWKQYTISFSKASCHLLPQYLGTIYIKDLVFTLTP